MFETLRGGLETLRDGSWLTPRRARTYPLLLIIAYIGIIVMALATAHGAMDSTGRPLGTDFSLIWAAGRSVLAGDPALPFDPEQNFALLKRLFGPDTQAYGFAYPPYFLAVAAALAMLPYLWALLVWQGATLALYAWVIARSSGDRWVVVAAIGFPAAFINIGHGHNGFLTAFLLGGGLLALDRRPWLAGLCFALLAYKPQFGLLLPLALLAGGYWRAIIAAMLGVIVMTGLSIWAFGVGSWIAFRDSLPFTRTVVVEQGNTGWEKIQSSFAAARALGASVGVAYAVQGAVTLLVIAATIWLWRSGADRRLKYAAVIIGSLLVTPYSLDYDMVALAPALAFALSHAWEFGFRPWQKTGLAAVYVAPFLTRMVAGATFVPLGLLAMLAFFAMVLVRAKSGDGDVENSGPGEFHQRAEGAVGRR